MSPTFESIIERLDDARQRWWLFSLLSGIVLAVTVSVAMLTLVVLVDTFRPLPLVWLRVLLLGWGTTAVTLLAGTLHRSIRHPRGLEATARRVELSFPDLGSHLINLVQFSSAASSADCGLRQAAIAEAATSAGSVSFHRAASRHTRWARWKLGLQTPRDLLEATVALVLVLGFHGSGETDYLLDPPVQ